MLSAKARSSQIALAAQLLIAGWVLSLALWRWIDPDVRPLGYAFIDASLAIAFYAMSRGRWFPAPLFFLHCALFSYSLYAAMIGSPQPWVATFLNRGFELALAYVGACALYRMARLAARERAG